LLIKERIQDGLFELSQEFCRGEQQNAAARVCLDTLLWFQAGFLLPNSFQFCPQFRRSSFTLWKEKPFFGEDGADPTTNPGRLRGESFGDNV